MVTYTCRYSIGQLIQGFLHHNITSCPKKVKLNCYKSLVRPVLEYASIVWAPHTISGTTSVEKVQRFSARFICNDYSRSSSVTEMLQSLSLPTLSQCQDTAKLVFMYKVLHQVVDVSVPDSYSHLTLVVTNQGSCNYRLMLTPTNTPFIHQ